MNILRFLSYFAKILSVNRVKSSISQNLFLKMYSFSMVFETSNGRCRSSTSRYDVTAISMNIVKLECDTIYLKIDPIRFDFCLSVHLSLSLESTLHIVMNHKEGWTFLICNFLMDLSILKEIFVDRSN